jgi:uncharacterized protein YjeT (DUF2065 family)
MARFGLILIVFGIIYIIKPTIYRRWFWKKTDVMQQKLSPENYNKYMRLLGVGFIAIGIVLLIIGKFRF